MSAAVGTEPILQVRGLTKRYGGLTAVKNLSFDLKEGGDLRTDRTERVWKSRQR